MATLIRFSFFFFSLVQGFLLPSFSLAEEDDVIQGINRYRASKGLANLTKHEQADCLADEISDDIENMACEAPINGASISTKSQKELPSLPECLKKCEIDVRTASEGIIMPVCVPRAVSILVVSNYTSSPGYAKYLNDKKFTGAGVGSDNDWTVVVLVSGKLANAAAGSLVSGFGFVHHLVSLVLGLSLILAC